MCLLVVLLLGDVGRLQVLMLRSANSLQEVRDSKNLFSILLKCDDTNFREGTTMLLWQIWRERNAVIWDGQHPDPHRAHLQAKIIRHEWQHVNVGTPTISSVVGVQRICRGWHNLHEGWMQCGVDAAFFADMNVTGVGIILRDAHGNFISARILRLPGCLRVEEGEAMGLCEALSWVKTLMLNNVEIVTDSKLVVDAIAARKQDISEFGAIIDGCRSLLESNRSFKVKHINRDANILAHRLAKLAKDFTFPHTWNEPPSAVEGLLNTVCSCSCA